MNSSETVRHLGSMDISGATHKPPDFYLISNVGTFMAGEPAITEYPRQLFLAQAFKQSPAYFERVRETITALRRREEGAGMHRFILDNGAHEGVTMDVSEYLSIAMKSECDVVVLPDVVSAPPDVSIRRAIEFLKLARQADQAWYDRTTFMYVGQGRTIGEVQTSYHWGLANLDPAKYIIGVGQAYLTYIREMPVSMRRGMNDQELARIALLTDIERMHGAHLFRYHILGMRWQPTRHYSYTGLRVEGMDSIKPIHCGHLGITYPGRPSHKVDPCDEKKVAPVEAVRRSIANLCYLYGINGSLVANHLPSAAAPRVSKGKLMKSAGAAGGVADLIGDL